MAEELKTVQPLDFYRHFLEQNIRPDSRDMLKFRPTSLNVGHINTANGSCLVGHGNTVILCGIKAELAKPLPDEPKKGFIVPNVDLPPLCSSRFKPGPPSEQAQVYSQTIADIIENSGCVHKEDLCIVEGKLCWCLYIDLTCLDYDGCVIDICVLALVSALKSAVLPKVSVNPEDDSIKVDIQRSDPVKVESQPVSSTFAIFDDHIILADPTQEEETLATGMITVVTKEDGSICNIMKPGGSGVNDSQLQQCMLHTKQRLKYVTNLINEAVLSLKKT